MLWVQGQFVSEGAGMDEVEQCCGGLVPRIKLLMTVYAWKRYKTMQCDKMGTTD